MHAPEGYRYERGLLWPAYDEKCARVVFKMAKDLEHILRYVPRRRTVIQAGGNCGVWPIALAPLFERVLTFEPDPRNYNCLRYNTKDLLNVFTYAQALGDSAGRGHMFTPDHETDNCGALQFVPIPETSPGNGKDPAVPMSRVDAFGVNTLDLLYLDIEGFEIPALQGSFETLARCKPVIVIEDKGLSERYGYKKGDAAAVLRPLGYRPVEHIHRDVVFVAE